MPAVTSSLYIYITLIHCHSYLLLVNHLLNQCPRRHPWLRIVLKMIIINNIEVQVYSHSWCIWITRRVESRAAWIAFLGTRQLSFRPFGIDSWWQCRPRLHPRSLWGSWRRCRRRSRFCRLGRRYRCRDRLRKALVACERASWNVVGGLYKVFKIWGFTLVLLIGSKFIPLCAFNCAVARC